MTMLRCLSEILDLFKIFATPSSHGNTYRLYVVLILSVFEEDPANLLSALIGAFTSRIHVIESRRAVLVALAC